MHTCEVKDQAYRILLKCLNLAWTGSTRATSPSQVTVSSQPSRSFDGCLQCLRCDDSHPVL
jgi:hypothetical protein